MAASLGDGFCRLCFEGGPDLIAPCACKGTSKWIHRDCLNRWRTSGSNPRALTNCCECGFQYRLTLERVTSSEGEERRHRIMRKLASQSLMSFVIVQALIVGFGILVRVCDSQEALVRFFHIQEYHAGDHTFVESLRHHKLTYYVAGLLVFLFLSGIMSVCFCCCLGPRQRHHPALGADCDFLSIYLCTDCGRACYDTPMVLPEWSGMCDIGSVSGNDDCGLCLVFLVVAVVAFIIIGILAAIIAVVMAVERAVQQFARVQEMRVLAEEYVVQDLSEAKVDQEKPQVASATTPSQVSVQEQVEKDLHEIFGERAFRHAAETTAATSATGYGSTSDKA
mmetsp:Transcript_20555/g.34054  ORF Transcript_20555/g.34054 Transcript_20555/m.34054 type:complete len:337 (+) Transcript_20555:82-1092(+)